MLHCCVKRFFAAALARSQQALAQYLRVSPWQGISGLGPAVETGNRLHAIREGPRRLQSPGRDERRGAAGREDPSGIVCRTLPGLEPGLEGSQVLLLAQAAPAEPEPREI